MTDEKGAAKTPAPAAAADPKKDRTRSPSYPAFTLQEAIEKAKIFYDRENFNWAFAKVAMTHWGLSPKGSGALRTLSALLQYGLFEETGSGDTRKVRLTARAKTILLAPEGREAERAEAIKKAAVSPKLYQSLWAKHGPNLPSSNNLVYELQTEGTYNAAVIRDLVRDFVATIEFAKLNASDTLGGGTEEPEEENDTARHQPPPPPSGTPPKPQPMPNISRTSAQETFDLPIPLPGNLLAVLRMPRPMSRSDYDFMMAQIDMNLKAFKPALTVPDQPASSGATEDPPS